MERVNVIGATGSGKSYVADAIHAATGLPVVRMDALRHGPNWSDVPEDVFRASIAEAVAKPGWILDGSYPSVRPLVWARADTVVWVDLDRLPVMCQVIRRSFHDWATGTEPIPGNRERLRNFVEPWHPIRWTWANHARFRTRERTWLDDPQWAGLTVIHLRSRADVDAFVRNLGP